MSELIDRYFVEEKLEENFHYDFDGCEYVYANSTHIDAFWNELKEKCKSIFEKRKDEIEDKDIEAIKDVVDELVDNYGFNFTTKTIYAITSWDEEGGYNLEAVDDEDNEDVKYAIEYGEYFEDVNGEIIKNNLVSIEDENYSEKVENTPYHTIKLSPYEIRSAGWFHRYFDTKTLYNLDNGELDGGDEDGKYEMRFYKPKEVSKVKDGMTEVYWSIEGVNKEGEVFYTNTCRGVLVDLWFRSHIDAVYRPKKIKQPKRKVKLVLVE